MPFITLEFKYTWRPYQKRVLDAVEAHLDDARLHIVAAPGAGKTTLGLEVFKRLEKPALVLSPTRVIRDQWIDRLHDFIDADEVASLEWVSKDLTAPKILTSITYQALHSKLSNALEKAEASQEAVLEKELDQLAEPVSSSEMDSFIHILKENKVAVIILDEAHHLRAEWWKALDRVCRELPDIVLVSLTATPPYDSRDHEWSRYEALCGPIDEEISVPELVKAGTLCAHQDYIWAVDAASSEKKKIKEHDERVFTLCNTLFESSEFLAIVSSHPWLNEVVKEQDIIKQPHIAIAILCFLNAREEVLSNALLKLLDLRVGDIPELGRKWWQVLVEAVLFSNSFNHSDEHKESVSQLKKQLRASELLYKRELSLERSRRLNRSLSQSISKVDACCDIHKLEYKKRADTLRQVILTDYIRDEALVTGVDTGGINLGAWPIFNTLVKESERPTNLALLTGRLSIIHSSLLDTLQAAVGSVDLKIKPLVAIDGYVRVQAPLNHLTGAFTKLLLDGQLNVLVGTRSLLGEGWDAPVVNSLILASAVGSFMLTNQMRGRAIRINRESPKKVSSIWHLVAIDHKSNYSGWGDYYDLESRFETFVGLSENESTIESGLERLNIKAFTSELKKMNPGSPVLNNNRTMRDRFNSIQSLGARWHQALTVDEAARVIPSVDTPRTSELRDYHVSNTLKYLLIHLSAILSVAVYLLLHIQTKSIEHFLMVTAVLFSLVAVFTLPETMRAVKILIRHLPIDGSLKQIGMALAHALNQTGLIETPLKSMKVTSARSSDGTFYIALKGGTFYEASLFADCFRELLGSIDNPRYLVTREGVFMGSVREDFHAVPLKLGVKKEYAEIFYRAWRKYVGPAELIYTRSGEGRKELLKARVKAFSSICQKSAKRQDRWQ